MTPAEERHKELMRIIMHGMYHQLDVKERNRFCELAGFYRSGKGRPTAATLSLPRATDLDFDDPLRFKTLVEKAMGRTIHQTPTWGPPHRAKGSKNRDVENRKAERHLLECEALRNNPDSHTTLELFERTTGINHPKGNERNYKLALAQYNSALRQFRRDIAEGRQQANIKAEQERMIEEIAKLISNTYNAHK